MEEPVAVEPAVLTGEEARGDDYQGVSVLVIQFNWFVHCEHPEQVSASSEVGASIDEQSASAWVYSRVRTSVLVKSFE